MKNFNIKIAKKSDLPALQNCTEKAYSPYISAIGKKPAPMTADFLKLISLKRAYTGFYKNHFAGFIICYEKNKLYHVENLAILPDFQGKGLGKALLTFAEKQAQEKGKTKLTLYTNEKMRANLTYYPKLGFKEVERKEQDGFKRVFFEKIIQP